VSDINANHRVRFYYGSPPEYSDVYPADYVNALVSGIPYEWDGLDNGTWADLDRAPKGGRAMTIIVTKQVGWALPTKASTRWNQAVGDAHPTC
jgi:hypothetical protein